MDFLAPSYGSGGMRHCLYREVTHQQSQMFHLRLFKGYLLGKARIMGEQNSTAVSSVQPQAQHECSPSPPIACISLSHSNNSLAMRIQKKVLGKLSSRGVMRHIAAEHTIHLMDNLYTLLNQFYPSKTAEKIVKNILKVTLKVGLQSKENRHDDEQKRRLDDIESQFREITLTILSFQTIAYSYDREFFQDQLNGIKQSILRVITGSLSEKSEDRVEHIFQHLSQSEMLDSIFKSESPHSRTLEAITDDLETLFAIGTGNIKRSDT